ncbi:hypothetical protein [Aquimonas sp.]|jgi:hypothetical protein|uniref:hypothetical protein n=1 Tax=Aquimonas sp. TaxID=1872588 RepID=UPI0037BEA67C
MFIQAVLSASLAAAVAAEPSVDLYPALDPAAHKLLSETVPGSSGWSEREDGVYFGRMQDGSKVRLLTADGMDVRKQELHAMLSSAKRSPTANKSSYAWMQQELEALDRMPLNRQKASQGDLRHASICGLLNETRGTFSADFIPYLNFSVAGGASIVRIPPFGPTVPPRRLISHGWASHGVGVPSQGLFAGQFDDYFTVISSNPVNGSWVVPEMRACEIQIDATISVGCTAESPTPYSYFSVPRWQTCEGLVEGSPINVW